MKKLTLLSTALLLIVALAAPAMAGGETVTLEGTIKCGRCTIKEDGLKDCQNILVVKVDGEETHYWLSKNDANTEFGDVCINTTTVRVTGQVEEKGDKLWLEASEIEAVEKS